MTNTDLVAGRGEGVESDNYSAVPCLCTQRGFPLVSPPRESMFNSLNIEADGVPTIG